MWSNSGKRTARVPGTAQEALGDTWQLWCVSLLWGTWIGVSRECRKSDQKPHFPFCRTDRTNLIISPVRQSSQALRWANFFGISPGQFCTLPELWLLALLPEDCDAKVTSCSSASQICSPVWITLRSNKKEHKECILDISQANNCLCRTKYQTAASRGRMYVMAHNVLRKGLSCRNLHHHGPLLKENLLFKKKSDHQNEVNFFQ